jgi:hypothetical protein
MTPRSSRKFDPTTRPSSSATTLWMRGWLISHRIGWEAASTVGKSWGKPCSSASVANAS